VLLPPLENRRSEDVVEELVARSSPARERRDRPEDAGVSLGELLEDRLHLSGRRRREVGLLIGQLAKVGCRQSDLRSRGRNEKARNARRDLLLLAAQLRHSVVEAIAEELRSAAEVVPECLRAERPRAELGLSLPESRQHHLEDRCLDASFCGHALTQRSRAEGLARHAVCPHLVENVIDELVFDLDRLVGRDVTAVLLDRQRHGVAGSVEPEVVDLQPIVEQARDPALEAVQLSERVIANRKKEVRPQICPVDRLRKLAVEGARPALLPVVEEILLELVEQQEQLAAHLAAPVVEHFRERCARGRSRTAVAAE
jgi:hypothetical protein